MTAARVMAVAAAASLVAVLSIGSAGAAVTAKKKISCAKVLKLAEVRRAVGQPWTGPKPEVFGEGDIGCTWGANGDHVDLDINPTGDSGFAFGQSNPGPAGYTTQPVTGVGQGAYFSVDDQGKTLSIRAKQSGKFFSVHVFSSADDATVRAQETALAKIVASRLR